MSDVDEGARKAQRLLTALREARAADDADFEEEARAEASLELPIVGDEDKRWAREVTKTRSVPAAKAARFGWPRWASVLGAAAAFVAAASGAYLVLGDDVRAVVPLYEAGGAPETLGPDSTLSWRLNPKSGSAPARAEAFVFQAPLDGVLEPSALRALRDGRGGFVVEGELPEAGVYDVVVAIGASGAEPPEAVGMKLDDAMLARPDLHWLTTRIEVR
jgi:hypothetical protein